MIIEAAHVAGTVIAAIVAGAFLGNGLMNRGFIGNSFIQIGLGAVFAYLLMSSGTITAVGAVAIVCSVTLSRIILRRYMNRHAEAMLAGDLGKEAQWIAELEMVDNDERFVEALKNTTSIERKEVKIEAESKEELREMVIERADQNR